MKLPFALLIIGILGFSLTSTEPERAGGSIKDEFAVSIRDQTPAANTVDDELMKPLNPNSNKLEGPR